MYNDEINEFHTGFGVKDGSDHVEKVVSVSIVSNISLHGAVGVQCVWGQCGKTNLLKTALFKNELLVL